MNDEQQNNTKPKTGLIDRRFFLKASSAAIAATAVAGSVISTSVAENPAANAVNTPGSTEEHSQTNKHWKAGWMAF